MKMLTTIAAGVILNVGFGSAVARAQYAPSFEPRGSYGQSSGAWQAQRIVRQAYLDILGREPDRSGLRQYTDAMLNRGWSEAEVRRSLRESDEYRTLARRNYRQGYGSGDAYRYGNSDAYRYGNSDANRYGNGYDARAESIVRRAYRDALGREPDPWGMREYTRRVVQDGWTESDVERAISQGYEYRRR